MKPNQKCIVSSSAPHHANRIGYFQFYGEDSSKGTAVLASQPVNRHNETAVLFAVSVENISAL